MPWQRIRDAGGGPLNGLGLSEFRADGTTICLALTGLTPLEQMARATWFDEFTRMRDPTLYFDKAPASGANREEAISLKHSTEHGIQFFVLKGISHLEQVEEPTSPNSVAPTCSSILFGRVH